jgi:hypothetical protein
MDQRPQYTSLEDRNTRIITAFKAGASTQQIAILTGLSMRRVQEIIQDVR